MTYIWKTKMWTSVATTVAKMTALTYKTVYEWDNAVIFATALTHS